MSDKARSNKSDLTEDALVSSEDELVPLKILFRRRRGTRTQIRSRARSDTGKWSVAG